MLISNEQFGAPGGVWDQYVHPSLGLNFSTDVQVAEVQRQPQ